MCVCVCSLASVTTCVCSKTSGKIFTLGFFLQFSGLLCGSSYKKQYNPVQQPYHVLLTFIWKTFSSYDLFLPPTFFFFLPTVLTKKYITLGSRPSTSKYLPCIRANLNLFQVYKQCMRFSSFYF